MHPKAMYKETPEGMTQQVAMSFDEQWKMEKEGWSDHPETARMVYIPVDEESEEEAAEEKKSLANMDKGEVEVYARTFGIELDKRKSLKNMLNDLEDYLK